MKQKIDVGDLRIGMYIVEIDRPWLDSPFLFQGFVVESQQDIDWVQRTCEYVYIDVEKAEQFSTPLRSPEVKPVRHTATEEELRRLASKTDEHEQTSFVEEFSHARTMRVKAKSYLKNVFMDIRQGQGIDTETAKSIVRSLVDSVSRNPDANLWFTKLRKKDEYTADHSLNVCVLTLVFARHLNLGKSVLNELGVGALLHDIGKLQIPINVLNKPGPLNSDEMALIKQHPTFGAEILKKTPGISKTAIDIAFCHHERVDGDGYPRGLKSDEISLFPRMIAIVDVYDAITSNRVYHHGMSPSDALRNMYQWQHKDFDASLVEDFIQCLGIYPVGSVVQLNTGDIGIVMSDNKLHRLKPTIMLVLDENHSPLFPVHIVNLENYDKDNEGATCFISKVFGPDEELFDIAQYILADLPEVNVA